MTTATGLKCWPSFQNTEYEVVHAAESYQVFAVNPMATARYRERHHIGGAKSDTADAKMLADLGRTDTPNHRQALAA